MKLRIETGRLIAQEKHLVEKLRSEGGIFEEMAKNLQENELLN